MNEEWKVLFTPKKKIPLHFFPQKSSYLEISPPFLSLLHSSFKWHSASFFNFFWNCCFLDSFTSFPNSENMHTFQNVSSVISTVFVIHSAYFQSIYKVFFFFLLDFKYLCLAGYVIDLFFSFFFLLIIVISLCVCVYVRVRVKWSSKTVLYLYSSSTCSLTNTRENFHLR